MTNKFSKIYFHATSYSVYCCGINSKMEECSFTILRYNLDAALQVIKDFMNNVLTWENRDEYEKKNKVKV